MHEHQDIGKLAYTIPEIAKLTGLSVSYLYRLSSEGELPVSKIGSRVLILHDELERWLKSQVRSAKTNFKNVRR